MFCEWSDLSFQSHPPAPSHRCDFLINTFPLAFVCLALFFRLRRRCSRSSFLLPLLRVLSLSLLFSHFLLFLFSRCQPVLRRQTPLAFGGVRGAPREKDLQAKQRESGCCWRRQKKQNSFGNSKKYSGVVKALGERQVTRWKKAGAGCRYGPHYAKVKDVWRKPAVNICITLYWGS